MATFGQSFRDFSQRTKYRSLSLLEAKLTWFLQNPFYQQRQEKGTDIIIPCQAEARLNLSPKFIAVLTKDFYFSWTQSAGRRGEHWRAEVCRGLNSLWLSPHWPFSGPVMVRDCGQCCRPRCRCCWPRCWRWHRWRDAASSSRRALGSDVCSEAPPQNSSLPRRARPVERWHKRGEIGFLELEMTSTLFMK